MTSQSVVLHRINTEGRQEILGKVEIDPVSKGHVNLTFFSKDGSASISYDNVTCTDSRLFLRETSEGIDEVGRCE
jgi:hypothetical protein